MIAAPGHERRGPRRIAQHHRQVLQVRARRHTGEMRKRDRTVDLGVDHKPRLMELHVVERDAERLAHKTVGAVAGDDIARRHALGPVRALHRQGHAAGCLLERRERHAAPQGHVRKARHPGLHGAFELGLEEEVIVRPAKSLRQPGRAEIADHAAVGADVDMPLRLAHQRAHRIGEAGRLEDAHHLVVDVHRARQRIGLGLALDHQRAQTRVAEQVRRHRADRAASDDRDLVLRSAPLMCGSRRR